MTSVLRHRRRPALSVLLSGILVFTTMSGGRTAAKLASPGGVWILYPTTPALGQNWVTAAWIVLGLVGTAVQLSITGRKRK